MGTLRQAFLDANACPKKNRGGLGTLISQHLCSEGRFFGGTPSVTSGQQWTKRFHNRSRTDLADKLHAQIDLLCFVSNQEMVKLYVEAWKEWIKKRCSAYLSFRAHLAFPSFQRGYVHTLQWQCIFHILMWPQSRNPLAKWPILPCPHLEV